MVFNGFKWRILIVAYFGATLYMALPDVGGLRYKIEDAKKFHTHINVYFRQMTHNY